MNHATNTSRFDGDLASFVILNTVVPIADAVQLHQVIYILAQRLERVQCDGLRLVLRIIFS